LTLRLDLRGEDEAGEAFAFVPGGPALLGGDSRASGSGALRSITLPPFSIARDPVTVGAFDRFLAAVRGDSLALAHKLRPAEFDQQLRTGPDHPVVGVSLQDAQAYAAWLATATDRVIRLPSADEWEKSVRAADGRTYPWGDGWRPSFCASVLTCQPADLPPATDNFPRDCSPFGVRGGAGGVWEWTNDSEGEGAVVVGGAVVSEAGGCRVAGRRALERSSKLRFLGFRVLMEPS
jgi:formylglycine-generating enzyme required for sulfatase activity